MGLATCFDKILIRSVLCLRRAVIIRFEMEDELMDKQTIGIPVNTRTVGDAKHIFEGIYVLYLEDYVHTFIKKLLYEQEFDDALEAAVVMYGSSFEKESQNVLVVSGAAALDEAGRNYFAQEERLCKAEVTLNKDRGIRFEISIKGTRVILDDFYIYYDQNEQMQGYLIEWNSKRHEQQMEKMPSRPQTDNAARLGRLALGCNKESARVSFLWGAMNVLTLSLVACAIAYGIISMNSYAKMKSMQKSIDYCMTFVSENMERLGAAAVPEDGEAVEAIKRAKPQAKESADEAALPSDNAVTPQEPDTESDAATDEEALEPPKEDISLQTEQAAQNETALQDETQSLQSINAHAAQYYVVQRGDTLGQICIAVYGDYSRMAEICKLNGLENPDSILYGQKLLLP